MLDSRRDQPKISLPLTQTYDTWNCHTPSINYSNCHSWNNMELQFGTTQAKVEDESGICSLPLWTRGLPRSPNQRRNYYRSLSPVSKTRAIERGQKELMEMVQNMPECNYELSLKDLVEPPGVNVVEEKNLSNKNVNKKGVVLKKGNGKIDSGGLYLKMVFPTSFGSKKKKKDESSVNNNSSKFSPRLSTSEKEWWKKNLLVFGGGSDGGLSSINSGSMKSTGSSSNSDSRNSSRHEMSGGSSCWPFIRRAERLSQK